jgi:site-specific recombinase XerD
MQGSLPQGLAAKTARKYLGNLKAFLTWCVDEGHIEKSPAGAIQIAEGGKAIDARLPFSHEQLTRLFASPQYTGHKSAFRRHEAGTEIIKDGKYYHRFPNWH